MKSRGTVEPRPAGHPRPRPPLTWAAKGRAGGRGGGAWGPAGRGVQGAGCGVRGQLGSLLLRLGLLARLRASLSLWGRKQGALSRMLSAQAPLPSTTPGGGPRPLVRLPLPGWPWAPHLQPEAVKTSTRETRGLNPSPHGVGGDNVRWCFQGAGPHCMCSGTSIRSGKPWPGPKSPPGSTLAHSCSSS